MSCWHASSMAGPHPTLSSLAPPPGCRARQGEVGQGPVHSGHSIRQDGHLGCTSVAAPRPSTAAAWRIQQAHCPPAQPPASRSRDRSSSSSTNSTPTAVLSRQHRNRQLAWPSSLWLADAAAGAQNQPWLCHLCRRIDRTVLQTRVLAAMPLASVHVHSTTGPPSVPPQQLLCPACNSALAAESSTCPLFFSCPLINVPALPAFFFHLSSTPPPLFPSCDAETAAQREQLSRCITGSLTGMLSRNAGTSSEQVSMIGKEEGTAKNTVRGWGGPAGRGSCQQKQVYWPGQKGHAFRCCRAKARQPHAVSVFQSVCGNTLSGFFGSR